jgi:hypothetical protein
MQNPTLSHHNAQKIFATNTALAGAVKVSAIIYKKKQSLEERNFEPAAIL